jgi:predicted nucleotidyltransferase
MDQLVYQRLRDATGRAFAGSPVLFAYVFGSVATGRNRPESDIDVAVYLDPSIPSDRFLDVTLDLAQRLAAASGMSKIDLVILNEAPLALLGRIIRERLLLYSRDEPARVRFESLTLREFFDFEIHARALNQRLLQDIAEGRR